MFDRRLVTNFDWGLLGLALTLGSIGLVSVYSAVTADPPPAPPKIKDGGRQTPQPINVR